MFDAFRLEIAAPDPTKLIVVFDAFIIRPYPSTVIVGTVVDVP